MPDSDDRDRPDSAPSGAGLNPIRAAIRGAVPSHFHDPLGLALRILRSGNRDAIAALVQAAIRLGISPLDKALALIAGTTGEIPIAPRRPILFVTGPPRSGTTLLHQLLIRNLPVAYITNLASLLPCSAVVGAWPLTASLVNAKVRLESYYGRTRALSGPSDGLEFWDRWYGPDRLAVPTSLSPEAASEMRQFFGRLEQKSGRPVVAKNNSLIASAHLVAAEIPTAYFVCLRRDPVYLAQSLFKARKDIHGSNDIRYGIDNHGNAAGRANDPIEDVWRQVRNYEDLQGQQEKLLGAERFIVIQYENLCADPSAVVRRLAHDVFGLTHISPEIEPLFARRDSRLSDEEFGRLAAIADARNGAREPR